MPRCLTQPCPLSLSFLPPRAVVRGLDLSLEFTFEVVPGGGVYDAAAPATAVPASSLLAACTRCLPWCLHSRAHSPSTLSLRTLLYTDYAPSRLRSKWFTGWCCMMPLCLTQPCPLPPYSLPAHAVVYFCRVAGYGGICSFPWLRFECTMLRCLSWQCPLSRRFVRVYSTSQRLHTLV